MATPGEDAYALVAYALVFRDTVMATPGEDVVSLGLGEDVEWENLIEIGANVVATPNTGAPESFFF